MPLCSPVAQCIPRYIEIVGQMEAVSVHQLLALDQAQAAVRCWPRVPSLFCWSQVEQLAWLKQHVDEKNYSRTCLYLLSCCAYLPEGDDVAVLRTAYDIYTHMNK